MNYKKLVSAALTATTVLWMVGAAALVPVASAQTTSSLQAQIAALLAQIQTLQSQLGTSAQTTTTSTGGTTYNFTSDLTVGSTGSAVTALQTFLIGQGDLVLATPTQYFGSMTQAALAKFQAAKGITPSVGYFGPKTRAFVNSMSTSTSTTTTTTTNLPGGCVTSAGFSSTTGVSCSSGVSTVVAPSTGLAVSLASTNPSTGSLISSAQSGSARVPVLAVNFTAGNSGPATLSGVNFQKTGVLSDSAISGAYLIENGQVLAQYNSLNSGLLTFSGLNLSIPAGQTVTLTLAVDISGGLSAGNTTGFSIPAASDVTAFSADNSAITTTGSFPMNGNVFTVTTVTNPSLATMTITSSSIGTQVTAGTQGNIVGSWNFTVGNSPVWLQNVNFHVIGSANVANLQNVKLLVNGTQVGQTLSSVPASGLADFNASTSSAKLNTGSNNVQIVADVMGSPSYYFQFEILNGYDVLAVDSQYNVPISITNTGGIGTQVGIQQGQITVNQDANTPTGNIAKGQSGVVLAKYDIYAAGEPVKVKFLDFNIQLGGQNTSLTLPSQIQNVSLTDDAGNQVGTSISQPPTSNSCGAGLASYSETSGLYTDCFGTSASPINYIVPANTTRVLSLKADIQTTANFSTITANLTGNTNNLQGMTSSQTGSTSGVSGVALTLVQSSLTVSANNALGTQNVSAGTTNIRIGSYAFSASSAEGVNVNTVSVQLEPTTTINPVNAFQNLKLMVNGTQFGTTQGVVNANTVYSFSGNAFNVPAGQTVNVDVYADSLSAASGTYTPATSLNGYTGVGQTSYTSVSLATTVPGQTVSFNGQPALTIAADSSNPPAGNIVQNSTGNSLAVFRFSETSNVENVKVTQLNVTDKVASSGVAAAFSNVSLWNGSTDLGTAASPVYDSNNGGYDYNFTSFVNPLIVPQGNSVSLTLKGDAGSYTNGSLSDNTTSTFYISSSTAGSGYVAGTLASSTLTVSIPSAIATGTYNYTVSINGVTSPTQNVTISATTTSTQMAAFATAIAGVLNGNNAYFGLPSNSSAVPTANAVVITSAGTTNMGASASVQSFGVSVSAVNNTGTGSTGTLSAVSVIARGATSNKTAIVTLSGATGNPQTTLRTTLAISASPVTSLPPASFQQLGSITLTANSAGDAKVNNLMLTFNNTASTSTFLNSVVLKDSSGNDVYLVDHLATSTIGGSSTTITWAFATSTNPLVITAGSSYTLTVWGNLALIGSIGNQSQSLTASIVGTSDFSYLDGTTGTPSVINLTTNQVPITVVSLTTPVGGQF
jgi:hypothetical protein